MDKKAISLTVAIALAGCATTEPVSTGKPMAPFGDADSIAYARMLWDGMGARGLVGPNAITARPYQGAHPHGAVLVMYEGEVALGGHSGVAIVNNNYDGDGVSEATVANDPASNLGAITVMYKRESGYDPDNADWFWAKYKPDGSLDVDAKGTRLAGRVAKGEPAGCIACHKLAPGADYVFNHDRYAN